MLNNRLVLYHSSAPWFVQVTYEPARQVASNRLATLPAYHDRQVVVYGPTNAGKSSTVQNLLSSRDGLKIYLDPHHQPGKCHPNTIVIGAGLEWDAIDSALDALTLEMRDRYQRLKTGDLNFSPITVAVDELSAMSRKLPTAGSRLIDLAQQGRKVRIYTILVPHSTEVEAMGFEGTGDARESFIFVQMHPVQPGAENKPHVATVYLGNPRRKGNLPLGRFIVPAPTLYQGQARLVEDLSSILFSAVVPGSQAVSETGSRSDPASETPGTAPQTSILPYEQRYANGTPEAVAIAEYLAAAGFSHRKLARLLPFKYEVALAVANTALRTVNLRQPKPAAGSHAERALALELHLTWGVPLHRIAALLDGNDHVNLARIQSYLSR